MTLLLYFNYRHTESGATAELKGVGEQEEYKKSCHDVLCSSDQKKKKPGIDVHCLRFAFPIKCNLQCYDVIGGEQ